MRQFIHQVIDIFRHQVSPVDYVPVLTHCRQKMLSVGTDKSRSSFGGKQHFPRLDDQCFLFREMRVVRSRRYLNSREESISTYGSKVEGEKLKDIMRIFEKRFGVEINILQEIIDYVLKRNIKVMRQFVVDDRNDFVVLLHSQNHLTDQVDFFAI